MDTVCPECGHESTVEVIDPVNDPEPEVYCMWHKPELIALKVLAFRPLPDEEAGGPPATS